MFDPRVPYDGTRGTCAVNHIVEVFEGYMNGTLHDLRDSTMFDCYTRMGLSDECAYVHTSGDLAGAFTDAGRSCEGDGVIPCANAVTAGTAPNTPDTCELNECLACEDAARNEMEYWKFAGRDLKNSGLIMYNQFYHVKYDCSYFLEENKIVKQDPYAKGNKSPPPEKSKLEYGDVERFDPSVSIQLNRESCLYNLNFSFKHDPTLPHAGGWDATLPNSVNRSTFEAHCSRDEPMIAEDGLPYRDRRKFTYNFEDDVKEITGIFDHMNIDFNPCGHHDEIFFGRPHYDMHMYTVSDEWRDIMQCDVTSCDYQDCIYDKSFQTTESGKAFFEVDACREPFPSFIQDVLDSSPDPVARNLREGSFNKNMPLGFVTLSHTGNPRSGTHALNVATALGWNDTQVERWDEPVMFMMTYDKLVTVYEPMVPVEFTQGTTPRLFLSPESPPLCKTNIGIPITYSAIYNNVTGYTTLNFNGESPECMCSSGKKTEAECAAHDAEMAAYDATYEKFATKAPKNPKKTPKNANRGMIGDFSVSEIESAFNISSGALKVPRGGHDRRLKAAKMPKASLKAKKKKSKKEAGQTYEDILANNFWTDLVGKPTVLDSLIIANATQRNIFMLGIASLGNPFFQNEVDMYHEHVTLGCFYRPKNTTFMMNLGLAICTDYIPQAPGEVAGISGFTLEWHVVGFVDEFTRLLYIGTDINSVQFMTEFALVKIVEDDDLVTGNVDFAYEVQGPSQGQYEGYSTPETVQDLEFYGNLGQFIVTQVKVDLDELCPPEYCGYLLDVNPSTLAPLPTPIPNPLAVNATGGLQDIPWPDKIVENKCEYFPCADLDGCSAPLEGECPSFELPEPELLGGSKAPRATKGPKKTTKKFRVN